MNVRQFLSKPIIQLDGLTVTVLTVVIIIAAIYIYRRYVKRG